MWQTFRYLALQTRNKKQLRTKKKKFWERLNNAKLLTIYFVWSRKNWRPIQEKGESHQFIYSCHNAIPMKNRNDLKKFNPIECTMVQTVRQNIQPIYIEYRWMKIKKFNFKDTKKSFTERKKINRKSFDFRTNWNLPKNRFDGHLHFLQFSTEE